MGCLDVSYRIHDLHKRVARKYVSRDAACKKKFQGLLSQIKQTNVKYAVGTGWPFSRDAACNSFFQGRLSQIKQGYVKYAVGWSILRSRLLVDYFSKLEVLVVSEVHGVKQFSLKGMGSLRFLSLEHCRDVQKIKAWEQAPNLISVRLSWCPSLRKVGDIGYLQKLQEVVLFMCRRLQIPDLTALSDLKALSLSNKISVESLASLGKPPKLQMLNILNSCLMDVGALGTAFTALQKLDLSGCWDLQKFPDVNLGNLARLNLEDCKCLESIEGSVWALTILEELVPSGCEELQRIPSLENLVRLKAFHARKCKSLREVQFGVSALASLQICELRGCTSLKCRPDLMNASMEELPGVQLQIFHYGSKA